jgi:hypothetical protein
MASGDLGSATLQGRPNSEHGPFQTNAIEYVGENVHARYVGPRTIGHKIWTIAL